LKTELGGDGEPVWLTPHPRDPQPKEKRERNNEELLKFYKTATGTK